MASYRAHVDTIVRGSVLGLVYLGSALFGLTFDPVSAFASLIWPPTGIALVALFIFGYRLWPGIMIGAFLANFVTGAPFFVALGIGIGNTLEAIGGVYLLKKSGFDSQFKRAQDAVSFIVYAAVISTMFSATIGVTSLWLGSVISFSAYGQTWIAWWVGDMIGNLILAPLLFILVVKEYHKPRQRLVEVGAVIGCTVLVGAVVFGKFLADTSAASALGYLIFLPLVWAALRLGRVGTFATMFILSVFAIWGTLHGLGPFVLSSVNESLLFLQLFIATVAATSMILVATVSERRATQEELKRLNQSLEILVRERTAKLEGAKSNFVSFVSHQFRTPLSIISWYTEALLSPEFGTLTEKQTRFANELYSASRRLTKLIYTILEITEVELGTMPAFANESLEVSRVMRTVLAGIKEEIAQKQLTIKEEYQDHIPKTYVDTRILEVVFDNIVTNAIRYTPPNGSIRISVFQGEERDKIIVSVSDTGYGIPEMEQPIVFTRPFRASNTDKHGVSGTGFGLYAVKALLTLIQGGIWFTSQEGKGTTFFVSIPIRQSND